MAKKTEPHEDLQKKLLENNQAIHGLSIMVTISLIGYAIAIPSAILLLCLNQSIWGIILLISSIIAGIPSYLCASATGHGMVDLSELGSGTGSVFLLPVNLIMMIVYILFGWLFALTSIQMLKKSNQQILSQNKNISKK